MIYLLFNFLVKSYCIKLFENIMNLRINFKVIKMCRLGFFIDRFDLFFNFMQLYRSLIKHIIVTIIFEFINIINFFFIILLSESFRNLNRRDLSNIFLISTLALVNLGPKSQRTLAFIIL